jgi:hypothetical protein
VRGSSDPKSALDARKSSESSRVARYFTPRYLVDKKQDEQQWRLDTVANLANVFRESALLFRVLDDLL